MKKLLINALYDTRSNLKRKCPEKSKSISESRIPKQSKSIEEFKDIDPEFSDFSNTFWINSKVLTEEILVAKKHKSKCLELLDGFRVKLKAELYQHYYLKSRFKLKEFDAYSEKVADLDKTTGFICIVTKDDNLDDHKAIIDKLIETNMVDGKEKWFLLDRRLHPKFEAPVWLENLQNNRSDKKITVEFVDDLASLIEFISSHDNRVDINLKLDDAELQLMKEVMLTQDDSFIDIWEYHALQSEAGAYRDLPSANRDQRIQNLDQSIQKRNEIFKRNLKHLFDRITS